MKLFDFAQKCRALCDPESAGWKDVSYQLTDSTLVLTARKAGKRTNPRQEIASYPLPERVVQLPIPSWVYAKDAAEDWELDRNDAVGASILVNAGWVTVTDYFTGTFPMFASEAREALEEFQRQATALLDL